MPPDSPNEQELMLKKRARRRLVGAVALVLLMIIVLPQVLQDRAVLAQQDPIKIVMQEAVNIPAPDPAVEITPETSVQAPVVSSAPETPAESAPEAPSQTTPPPVANIAEPVKPPMLNESAPEKKGLETSVSKSKEMFTVQVGVYSDATNVKRLQEQLKQAGFVTKTEKIKTAKGESIRLKAGSYQTRQDASLALAKIKELGLPGMVLTQ